MDILKSLNLDKNKTLVLSISGGVDSMVMLNLLKRSDFNLAVVHFDHLKRLNSKLEKKLVEEYCQEHEIPFYYYKLNISEGNFHNEAHQLRKYYLQEVAKANKTPYILTAHHQDDLFENVLIKLTRGSNLLGYAGMQPIYEKDDFIYVKPLLFISKDELIEYANENNISYLEDESNEETLYLRNRYRHTIVPIMKQENPQLLNQITKYNKQITDAFNFIRSDTIKKFSKTQEIDLKKFNKYHPALQDDIIAYLLEQYKLEMSFDLINKLKEIILASSPNLEYNLGKNHTFIKTYDKAFIMRLSKDSFKKSVIKEGQNKFENKMIFTLSTHNSTITEEFTKLCYNELAFPLILRRRINGDVLTFSYGRKKLKDFFIDEKVPKYLRDKLYVLTDSKNTILWVENYYLNDTLGDKNCLHFLLERGK